MTLEVFITLFLVFLNGFFVAAEFAIVKVRSSQIALEKGTLSKEAAKVIINNLDGFLAATQLGITLASLGLGWVGEDVVSELVLNTMHALGINLSDATAHRIALPVAFIILTIMHIVFGELAPKSIAIRYPASTTLRVSLALRAFYFVFRPFIWLLNGLANLILKIFGIKPMSEIEIHSEEELKLIIAESEEGGAIETSERELIQNVFDFDNRVARQVMVPRVKMSMIKADTSIAESLNIVLREGYSRYPIYEQSKDEIVGVVHSKDIVQVYIQNSGKTLKDIMRSVHFIPETKPIDMLLRDFQRTKAQMAFVVSEFGGIIGLVTLEDILEELVGEIQDEHDQEQQIVIPVDKQTFHIAAQSSLHDINKLLEVPFPESEDYETLAGLITFERPSVKEGDEFILFNYRIKVLKITQTLPEQVEVKLQQETVQD
ncbi:MAG: HlyC/CorC family transporter [Cyclobacteriaceae bacterium]|nr:HlyC/CorC family transporter [Cytophagales bacterium]MBX2900042.1 HlyC/CorC family transporter [Cyclobacteriaceae bacterium]